MPLVELEERPPAFILRLLGSGLFCPDLLEELARALDRVEASQGAACLVLTGADKSFSTGFDLDALRAGPDVARPLVAGGIALLGRLLGFGVPCAAAVNGHAFGIGAMLALACDFRLMREDRGYFCLPEIDLGMPFAPAMTALLQAKLEPAVLADAVLSGRRIGGSEAAQLRIVDESCPQAELLDRSVGRVSPLAEKDRATYAALKRGLHERVLKVIGDDTSG